MAWLLALTCTLPHSLQHLLGHNGPEDYLLKLGWKGYNNQSENKRNKKKINLPLAIKADTPSSSLA